MKATVLHRPALAVVASAAIFAVAHSARGECLADPDFVSIPDTANIVYLHPINSIFNIYTMSQDGSNVTNISNKVEFIHFTTVAVSPNRRYVAFATEVPDG